MKNDIESLAHISCNCKYHIVFAPKYRRKVFYGSKRNEMIKILKELCRELRAFFRPRQLSFWRTEFGAFRGLRTAAFWRAKMAGLLPAESMGFFPD